MVLSGWDIDLFLKIYAVCTPEQGHGLNRAVKITTQSNKPINETARGKKQQNPNNKHEQLKTIKQQQQQPRLKGKWCLQGIRQTILVQSRDSDFAS